MQEHNGVRVCSRDSLHESALALRQREVSPVGPFRAFIVDHHHGGLSPLGDLDGICNHVRLACGSDPCKTDIELCVRIWRSKTSAGSGSECKRDGLTLDQINPNGCGEEAILRFIEAGSAAKKPSGICAQLLADCQASLPAIHLDLNPIPAGNRRNQIAFPDLGQPCNETVLCDMVDIGCANLRIIDDPKARILASCRSGIIGACQVCECRCWNGVAICIDARSVEGFIDAMCGL